MDISEKVSKICPFAQYKERKNGEAIFCQMNQGIDAPNSIEFMNIAKGEVCLATNFYPTGHINYSSDVDVEKMKTCPYLIKIKL
jgi:hypothetical protein